MQLGRTSAHKHNTQIKDGAKPVRLNFYGTSLHAQREIERQVNEMLEHDIIQPSHSEWHSAVVLVKKKNNK